MLALIRGQCSGTGWIAERVLREHSSAEPIYFDSIIQVVMPTWHRDWTVLLGDACGRATLVAEQGASMAMTGPYAAR